MTASKKPRTGSAAMRPARRECTESVGRFGHSSFEIAERPRASWFSGRWPAQSDRRYFLLERDPFRRASPIDCAYFGNRSCTWALSCQSAPRWAMRRRCKAASCALTPAVDLEHAPEAAADRHGPAVAVAGFPVGGDDRRRRQVPAAGQVIVHEGCNVWLTGPRLLLPAKDQTLLTSTPSTQGPWIVRATKVGPTEYLPCVRSCRCRSGTRRSGRCPR